MENIILIVDDHHETVDTLSALFLQSGWMPQRAYSGEDALISVSRAIPSVVVCDLAMPGISGFDVAEWMRNRFTDNCPVLIALTGWSDSGVAKQALDAGFSVILNKPVDFEHLLSVVKLGSLAHAGLEATTAASRPSA